MYLGQSPRRISVPKIVIEKLGDTTNVEMRGTDEHKVGKYGAQFVTSRNVCPHIDDGYLETLFITMSLRDGFDFGGMWQPRVYHRDPTRYGEPNDGYGEDEDSTSPPEIELKRGMMFIIDPAQYHWLHASGFGWMHYNTPRWWCLQWEIPVDGSTEQVIRDIVESYGATWAVDEARFEKFMKVKRKQVRQDKMRMDDESDRYDTDGTG